MQTSSDQTAAHQATARRTLQTGPAFPIKFAFQPIVDLKEGCVFSYEALVRGACGQPASSVFERVTPETQYSFDQACRVKAITYASALGIDVHLNVNFMPQAIYQPAASLWPTLAAANRLDFPIEQIVFEVTESETVEDPRRLAEIFREHKRCGFMTAIDDFGAGYAGLGLLSEFQPDLVKLDIQLVRDVDRDLPKQAIVRAVIRMCDEIGSAIVAEGVETEQEAAWLSEAGIDLFQGYLFAKPAFMALPALDLETVRTRISKAHPSSRRARAGRRFLASR